MNGYSGQATPYLLEASEWVAAVLFFCFIATAYVFSINRHILFQHARHLFFVRERESAPPPHAFCRVLLFLQTSLLTGLFLLKYNIDTQAIQPSASTVPLFLTLYTSLTIVFFFSKWLLYKFVNWIYFSKSNNSLWSETYFFIVSFFGLLLFPFILLIIYTPFPLFLKYISCLIVFFCFIILILYKAFCIFFNRLHGLLYLFLYFCTLEVLPFLIAWKGMEMLNGILI